MKFATNVDDCVIMDYESFLEMKDNIFNSVVGIFENRANYTGGNKKLAIIFNNKKYVPGRTWLQPPVSGPVLNQHDVFYVDSTGTTQSICNFCTHRLVCSAEGFSTCHVGFPDLKKHGIANQFTDFSSLEFVESDECGLNRGLYEVKLKEKEVNAFREKKKQAAQRSYQRQKYRKTTCSQCFIHCPVVREQPDRILTKTLVERVLLGLAEEKFGSVSRGLELADVSGLVEKQEEEIRAALGVTVEKYMDHGTLVLARNGYDTAHIRPMSRDILCVALERSDRYPREEKKLLFYEDVKDILPKKNRTEDENKDLLMKSVVMASIYYNYGVELGKWLTMSLPELLNRNFGYGWDRGAQMFPVLTDIKVGDTARSFSDEEIISQARLPIIGQLKEMFAIEEITDEFLTRYKSIHN